MKYIKGDLGGSSEAKAPQARRSRINRWSGYTLLTLRENARQFISIQELNDKLSEVKKSLTKYECEWSDNVGYELTKENVLHLHTYCTSKRAPWYKSTGTWNIQLKSFPVTDIWEVINYIQKDGTHPALVQQREAESRIYHTPITELFIE